MKVLKAYASPLADITFCPTGGIDMAKAPEYLALSNVMGVLWAASMFAWFFVSALYLQGVLGYSAMQVGVGVSAFRPDHGGVLAGLVGQDGDALGHVGQDRQHRLCRGA